MVPVIQVFSTVLGGVFLSSVPHGLASSAPEIFAPRDAWVSVGGHDAHPLGRTPSSPAKAQVSSPYGPWGLTERDTGSMNVVGESSSPDTILPTLALQPGWNLVGGGGEDGVSLASAGSIPSKAIWSLRNDGSWSPTPKPAGRGTQWIYVPEVGLWPRGPWSPAPSSSRSAPPGWSMLGVPDGPSPLGPDVTRVARWDPASQTYTLYEPTPVSAHLAPGEIVWVFRRDAVTPFGPSEASASDIPMPPHGVQVWINDEAVQLQWKAPIRFQNGAKIPGGTDLGYQVYRDGIRLTEGEAQLSYRDSQIALGRRYEYQLTAFVREPGGPNKVSRFSYPFRVSLNGFGNPHQTAGGRGEAALSDRAVVRHETTETTHFVYVEQGGDAEGGQLRYVRQTKSGPEAPSVSLATASPGLTIDDVTISAGGERVSVAWIEESQGTDGAVFDSRIRFIESADGGVSFSGAPQLLRKGNVWKRGLDSAYDHLGRHHLVWGEGNKVYYLQDQSGPASNVFDVHRRYPNTIVVDYWVPYPSECEGDADCPCYAFTRERYDLALEEIQPHEEAQVRGCLDIYDEFPFVPKEPTFGPYLFHCDEAFVTHPSLVLDEKKISILAYQTRRWDNKPVRNESWTGEHGPATPPTTPPANGECPVEPEGQRKKQLGFRHAQKKDQYSSPRAKSVNEDRPSDLVHSRAFQANEASYDPDRVHPKNWYFYEREGTWDESKAIKAAQRPLAGKTLGITQNKEDWALGTWQNDAFQKWQIFSIDSVDDTRWADTPAYRAFSEHAGLASAAVDSDSTRDSAANSKEQAWTAARDSKIPTTTEPTREPAGDAQASPQPLWGQSGAPRSSLGDGDPWTSGGDAVAQERKKQQTGIFFEGGAAFSVGRQDPATSLAVAGSSPEARKELSVETVAGDVSSNNRAARRLRNELHRTKIDSDSNQRHDYFVEYQLDPHSHETGNLYAPDSPLYDPEYWKDYASQDQWAFLQQEWGLKENDLFRLASLHDSNHLARLERVWAYTQGIALAQLSRSRDREDWVQARGLARYLCAHAVYAVGTREPMIRGWHFSWNTLDPWKDARLVTGANAWVIHGLGAFLVSRAAADGGHGAETDALKACYHAALAGLLQHRARIRPEDRLRVDPKSCETQSCVSLMTAGWTTAGLQKADAPRDLGIVDDGHVRLAYYDILDALGYDAFDPLHPPVVRQRVETPAGKYVEIEPLVLTDEPDTQDPTLRSFSVLKRRVQAENVVTEHNLDVLSVLNHALKHAELLEVPDKDALRGWRDELRRGIFELLWDSDDWRNTVVDPNEASLDLGRVVTGGAFSEEAAGAVFRASKHVAVDNCSWLALFVNHDELNDEEVTKLAQCLDYTVRTFASEKEFRGQSYYGAHYFLNTFRDPYILENARQESSYHLEATMGLIGGLRTFADAHPKRKRSEVFRKQSRHMWAQVQAFVRDHGFAYSSERIQDLSTLLWSNTAALWFIDVHDDFAARDRAPDRPLLDYARTVPPGQADALKEAAYTQLQARTRWLPVGAFEGSLAEHAFLVSGTRDGRSYVSVEDQALALLAALHQQDDVSGQAWAEALLALAQDPGPVLRFPSLAWLEDTGGSGPSEALPSSRPALALYALFRWAEREAQRGQLNPSLRERLAHTLEALLTEPPEPLPRPYSGLIWESHEEPATVHVADNVMAFFALQAASKVLDEGASLSTFQHRSETMGRALDSLCFHSPDKHPVARLTASGTKVLSGQAHVYVLCGLFLASRSRYEDATKLLEDLFSEQASTEPSVPHDGRAHRWADAASAKLLVQRAVFSIDPRQEALRLLNLLRFDDPTQLSATDASLLILSDANPGGAFMPPQSAAEGSFVRGQQKEHALSRLAENYVEIMGSLFASPLGVDGIDAVIQDLTAIDFAFGLLQQDVPKGLWVDRFVEVPYEQHVAGAVYRLRNLCPSDPLIARASYGLEAFFGLPCHEVERAVDELLEARFGWLDPSAFAILSPLQGASFDARTDRFLAPRPSGLVDFESKTVWTLLAQQGPVNVAQSAPVAVLRPQFRERLARAIEGLSRGESERQDPSPLRALPP